VDDLKFINQLQVILLIIAMISILSSVFVGIYFAKTLTRPILKTIDATKSIASGHYDYSIDYRTNITEVSELIDSINYLSKTLNEQDRIKKQITSDVAHELRTPLSTLLLNIEAVRDGLVDLDSNRLKSLYDEVLRLTSIVKDLEQLNKIEVSSQKLDYQMFDIKELLIECINSLNVKLDEKNIDVILKVDSNQIEGDRNRLYQVFYNLILNACLYSNQNSQVFITSEIKDHYITIEVKDNGIGIPEESLPYIFERFYRVDSSRNRDSGGSGIGLTIVKQFVEAHEGRVEVESQLNVGTTFTIILPIKKSS
jgi:signal transduction histidine kinase